jgi:uncharacterized protein YebE (UPF0316 family)
MLRVNINRLMLKAWCTKKDPKRLKDFIRKFNPDIFGINYDTGNSAALGFHVKEERATQ